MTDAERLAEIRERCERATHWNSLGAMQIATGGDEYSADQTGANLMFCICSRDDVPYLLALAERLTAENERLHKALEHCVTDSFSTAWDDSESANRRLREIDEIVFAARASGGQPALTESIDGHASS